MQTDRERAVTELVSLWITNDRQHYGKARQCAQEGNSALQTYIRRTLFTALSFSAARQVANELSSNDYSRIDWASVARDLIGE